MTPLPIHFNLMALVLSSLTLGAVLHIDTGAPLWVLVVTLNTLAIVLNALLVWAALRR